jgi:hypothetical protein
MPPQALAGTQVPGIGILARRIQCHNHTMPAPGTAGRMGALVNRESLMLASLWWYFGRVECGGEWCERGPEQVG